MTTAAWSCDRKRGPVAKPAPKIAPQHPTRNNGNPMSVSLDPQLQNGHAQSEMALFQLRVSVLVR